MLLPGFIRKKTMMTEDSPIFANPVSKEEFESELEKFYAEEELAADTGKTLSSRWVDLALQSEGIDCNVHSAIMDIAMNERSLHDSLYRILVLGLEIGYRLGSK